VPWFWWYIAKGRRPRLFDGDKKRAVFLGLLVGAIYFLTYFLVKARFKTGVELGYFGFECGDSCGRGNDNEWFVFGFVG